MLVPETSRDGGSQEAGEPCCEDLGQAGSPWKGWSHGKGNWRQGCLRVRPGPLGRSAGSRVTCAVARSSRRQDVPGVSPQTTQ